MKRILLLLALFSASLLTACKTTNTLTKEAVDVERVTRYDTSAVVSHFMFYDTITTKITEHVKRTTTEKFNPETGVIMERVTEEDENREQTIKEIQRLHQEIDSLSASLESFIKDKSKTEIKEKSKGLDWRFYVSIIVAIFALFAVVLKIMRAVR